MMDWQAVLSYGDGESNVEGGRLQSVNFRQKGMLLIPFCRTYHTNWFIRPAI